MHTVFRARGLHAPADSASSLQLHLQVDNDDMVATLESIVEKFGEEMAPYAVGLMQHLAIAFWRILDADDKVSGGTDGAQRKLLRHLL